MGESIHACLQVPHGIALLVCQLLGQCFGQSMLMKEQLNSEQSLKDCRVCTEFLVFILKCKEVKPPLSCHLFGMGCHVSLVDFELVK